MNDMTDLSEQLRVKFSRSGLWLDRLSEDLNTVILKGDIDEVKRLIGYGVDLNRRHIYRMPECDPYKKHQCVPLDLALRVGHSDMVDLLLKHEARSHHAFENLTLSKLADIPYRDCLRSLLWVYVSDVRYVNFIPGAFKTFLQQTGELRGNDLNIARKIVNIYISEARDAISMVLLPPEKGPQFHPEILAYMKEDHGLTLRSPMGRFYGRGERTQQSSGRNP